MLFRSGHRVPYGAAITSDETRQVEKSGFAGSDLVGVRFGKQAVFDEPAAAERDLTSVGGDPHNDGVTKDAAQRAGIPGNSPAGNHNAVWVECMVIHHVPYRQYGENLKRGP